MHGTEYFLFPSDFHSNSSSCTTLTLWDGYNNIIDGASPLARRHQCQLKSENLNITASLVVNVFFTCTAMFRCKMTLAITSKELPAIPLRWPTKFRIQSNVSVNMHF